METIDHFINTRTGKVVFGLSAFVALYWVIAWTSNVYSTKITGAIFEILWPVVMLGTFVLPLISMVCLIRTKFSFRSLHLYAIILIVVAVLAVRLIND
jgi:hypothetical protein